MKRIEFRSESFDALVCLDADLPEREFFDKVKGIPILAADGAAIGLKKLGIEAWKIIGDLDTLKTAEANNNFNEDKLIYLPGQETNDFEKTLNYADENGFHNILILGFHGGLLEHALNNWSVFIKFAEKLNLCIYDKGRYAVPISEDVSLNLKKNEIVSIIPQPRIKLTTRGLRWNLKGEILSLGFREGARNVAETGDVSVWISEGEALLFFDDRAPKAPIAL